MQRLDCHVKEYGWGKKGRESEVARLFAAGHQQFRVGADTPYAELWMGTHPDGAAKVRPSAEHLSRLIARSNSQMGMDQQAEEIHLPFIMKIMSIQHTLSLQVHPTKEQAAQLHQLDPLHYPDRNHKPELAYALTRFELLCGFRPANEILENMRAFPELRVVMGEENCKVFECCYSLLFERQPDEDPSDSDELKEALKQCFATMLQQQVDRPSLVERELKSLYRRIANNVRGCLIEPTIAIMLDTYERFPTDVGCFAPLYLNHIILEPGECCYYAAEELHAYLSGECVECVGCSNNTIRAALTPKYIDRKNLVNVLNYRMTTPSFYMIPPIPIKGYPHIVEFAPTNCADFTLHQIEVPATTPNEAEETVTVELPALDCPSIIVVVEGDAQTTTTTQSNSLQPVGQQWIGRGDIFYIQPNAHVSLQVPPTESMEKQRKRSVEENHTEVSFGRRFLAYRTFSYEPGPDHSTRIIVAAPGAAAQEIKGDDQDKTKKMEEKIIEDEADELIRLKVKLYQRSKAPFIRMEKNGRDSSTSPNTGTPGAVIFDVESEMDGFL